MELGNVADVVTAAPQVRGIYSVSRLWCVYWWRLKAGVRTWLWRDMTEFNPY